MYKRDEVKDKLTGNIVTVTFEKVDGTERVMRCTLMEDYLPKVDADHVSTRKHNDDVLAVWDLDAGGWRSFRIESIKSIAVG